MGPLVWGRLALGASVRIWFGDGAVWSRPKAGASIETATVGQLYHRRRKKALYIHYSSFLSQAELV